MRGLFQTRLDDFERGHEEYDRREAERRILEKHISTTTRTLVQAYEELFKRLGVGP